MALRSLLALFLLVLGACGASPLRARGLAPAPTTAEALGAALEPRRVAVVVGVDSYSDPAFPDLRHARADADAVGDRLAASGFDAVHRLVGPERTERAVVLSELRRLGSALRPEDTFVLYISGHGSRVPDGPRWRRFLLTGDSRAGGLEASAIDLHALEDWFGRLRPVRKALILDACFSGDGKSVVRPGAPAETELELFSRTTPVELDAGELHLHATSPGRAALEDDRLGHGVYTHHLLEALSWESRQADLDDDGVVTAFEAHVHARERTRAWTDGTQVPEIIMRSVGEADVVLSGDLSRRKRDRALIYLLDGVADLGAERAPVLHVDGRAKGALNGGIALSPGVHTLSLVDADGTVRFDGRTRLRAGRAYGVQELERRVLGSSVELRAGLVGSAHALVREVGGGSQLGVEVGLVTHRVRERGRGAGAGAAVSVGGIADGARGRGAMHTRVWAQQRNRWRGLVTWAGVGLALDLVPAADPQGSSTQPDGWYLFTALAEGGAGIGIRPNLSVYASARPQLGAFDLDKDGIGEPVAWVTGSAGVLWGW